jgi:hypothetical protein
MTNLYGKLSNGGFFSLHLTGHEAPYLQKVSAGLMTGKRRPFVFVSAVSTTEKCQYSIRAGGCYAGDGYFG